jgi:hypothetical protein
MQEHKKHSYEEISVINKKKLKTSLKGGYYWRFGVVFWGSIWIDQLIYYYTVDQFFMSEHLLEKGIFKLTLIFFNDKHVTAVLNHSLRVSMRIILSRQRHTHTILCTTLPTLTRFFALHFLIPFVISAIVLIHLLFVH